uniref:Bifunctional inhibitor/plant lipid transfer protein/seed storage helical domain-containing protein n=1 Tax=Chenopodium quinoa TaxID=63459 RepID=A0A803NAR7_CHEQI
MAPKIASLAALFLALNLVLCNLAFSHNTPRPIETCPEDTLKLNVCADVLKAVHVRIGSQKKECCNLIGNIIKLDAAACLCTAVHADILVLVHLNLPIDLTLLVNKCGCELPKGFECPPRLA